MADPIRIDGLADFSRNLRKLDNDLPKALRVSFNDAVNVVVDYARPRVPKRSGQAARSIKSRSTRTEARVSGGGRRVPYYPWLDFGGKVGPARSVDRPFRKEGRYLWKGLIVKREEFGKRMEQALLGVARSAGVEVD